MDGCRFDLGSLIKNTMNIRQMIDATKLHLRIESHLSPIIESEEVVSIFILCRNFTVKYGGYTRCLLNIVLHHHQNHHTGN